MGKIIKIHMNYSILYVTKSIYKKTTIVQGIIKYDSNYKSM